MRITWQPRRIQLFLRDAPRLSRGWTRYSRTTMTTSTKAMTKVVMLCQGLVYNPKTISAETLTVLALHSEVRRYSNLLLCNYSASGTLSMNSRRDMRSWSVSNLLFCPSLLITYHCLSTFSCFTCSIITINLHQADGHIQLIWGSDNCSLINANMIDACETHCLCHSHTWLEIGLQWLAG